ncbi:MAG: putative glycoside hydrolase [Endomicrobiia bacterium]|nr:putative glycoside hydrolase [Endomicrobiia bacterium]
MRKYAVILLVVASVGILWFGKQIMCDNGPDAASKGGEVAGAKKIVRREIKRPAFVRGVHLSAWAAGSKTMRSRIDKMLDETEINYVVIAIKEYKGDVYIGGVDEVNRLGVHIKAIPDIENYLADLKSRGVFTSARIVVFKDDAVARKKPEWAVKDPDGNIWQDRKKIAWLDPYNKDVWDYNLKIAERAAELGFDEIQFDYIRFPSDGNTRLCRYSVRHTSSTAVQALADFLKTAHARLKPYGVDISICVFGLTTTSMHDLGIGQRITELSESIDAVCPMVYPSHYNPGEYGLPNPNSEPYKTVYYSISGAAKRLGAMSAKIRPYLQDFSLGHRYGAKEVREQIQACYDAGVYQWILWDPNCRYTRDALESAEAYESFVKEMKK